MTEAEKKKMRAKAAKLSKPTPIELPSGMWRCQVTVGGERVGVVDSDPSIAHAKALALKAGLIEERGKREAEKKGDITLMNAIDHHVAIRRNVLSPSTVNGYEEIKRNRFRSLMDMKIKDIDFVAIQSAINDDAKRVGRKTIKNALALVSAVLSDYGKEFNAKKFKLPQKVKKPPRYYEEAELVELFDLIRGSFIELPILLATWLGLRRSEIFGLCWDAIDFEKGKIEIKRAYVKAEDHGYILREYMKTSESRRTLSCPGYILSKLDAYAPKSNRTGRIFTMHPNTPYQTLKDMCERSGLNFVGVHGLRHTNASVMVSLGVMDKYIMAEGGWSTDHTMKKVYQHIFESGRKGTAEKRDSFFDDISAGINPSEKENLHTDMHTEK